MRLLIVYVLCICGMVFIASCKDKPESGTQPDSNQKLGDYSIREISGPLTDKQFRQCLSALGLSVRRFTINIPERSAVKFNMESFENGAYNGRKGSATSYLDAGLREITICKVKKENHAEFSIHKSSGSVTLSTDDLEAWGATTWGVVPIEKLTTEKQPLCFFAANKNGISGYSFNNAGFNKQDFVNKYEYAMIIYAQLQTKEDVN